MSVVDPLTMKVHGMENLRVVDASAMPRTTNGNIHAPVLMLAEKAADIIRGKKPLEPQYVDYYKHGVSDENAGAMEFRSILPTLIIKHYINTLEPVKLINQCYFTNLQ